ncbi:MAG: hypothetical protein AMXMBFR59_00820 [Rhodanobacteraceae bacterium]
MYLSRSLFGLMSIAFAAAAQASVWSYRSPEGASGISIAQAGNRLLLGTRQGLEISDDDGASWSRLDTLPRWSYVTEILVDPADVRHWYVRFVEFMPADEGSAMFHLEQNERIRETWDGGATWQALALPGEALVLPIVHPVATGTMVIRYRDTSGNSGARAMSLDGGAHWTPTARALTDPGVRLGIGRSRRHFVGHSFGYLPGSIEARLHLSPDNLASWSSPVASFPVSGTDTLQLYARASSPEQLFWTDAATWGLPGRSGVVDLITGAVTTFPETSGLLTHLRDDLAYPGSVSALHLGGFASCNYCIREEVLSLAPGATQWQVRGGIRLSAKRINSDVFFGQMLDAGAGKLWLTDESTGLQYSADAGANWSVRNTGTRAASISAVAVDPRNGDRLLAGRDMQSLQRSDDGGRSWSDVGGEVPYDVRSLTRSPVNPDHVLATADAGFYRSLDAGATWQRVVTAIDPAPDTRGWRDIVWCANNDTHLLAQVGNMIYRSLDGGMSWAIAADDHNLRLESARRAPGRVYLLRSNSYAVTADCGVTFDELGAFAGSSRALAVDPNDDRHLVSTGVAIPNEMSSLRVSVDGGSSWTTVLNPVFYSVRNGWIDACDRERYTTYDLRVMQGTIPQLTPEPLARLSGIVRVNAADSQCINGESVSAIGTPSGLWLRRAPQDQLFADSFGID